MSLRQFAHRVGCSHTLVQKAIRKKLLVAGVVRDAKGRPSIADPDAAELQWRVEKIGEGKFDEITFIEAQTRSALELAAQRRLANRQRRGELIEARLVKQVFFKLGRILRDNLQNIPSRIADLLAAETNARRCHNMLDAEIKQTLGILTPEALLAALSVDTLDPSEEDDESDAA